MLSVVLAVTAGACAPERPDPTERALALLAAHRAPDIELRGEWVCTVRGITLYLGPVVPGGWIALVSEGGQGSSARGSLTDGVLQLETSVAGTTRLHLCRFGETELLVAEPPHVAFEDGTAPVPTGLVFERRDELDPAVGSYQFPPWADPLPMRLGEESD